MFETLKLSYHKTLYATCSIISKVVPRHSGISVVASLVSCIDFLSKRLVDIE